LQILKKVFSIYFKRFYFAIFLYFICFAVLDLYLKNSFINKKYLKEIKIKFEFDNAKKSIADYAALDNYKIFLKKEKDSNTSKNTLIISKKIITSLKRSITSHLQSFSRIKFSEINFDLSDDVFIFNTLNGAEINSYSNEEASIFLKKKLKPILESEVRILQNSLADQRFFSQDAINLIIQTVKDKDTEILLYLNKALIEHNLIYYKGFSATNFFLKSENFFSITVRDKSYESASYWVIILVSFIFMNIAYLLVIYLYYYFRSSKRKKV
tara:strand:+ start:3547 stop:4353 length:807 start_codon:yes stop_codon:yes gene_type:complete